MRKGKAILYTSGLLVVLVVCASWGFLVHRTVNQLAVYELRGELRKFFFQNLDYLVRNAPRPDLRRNQDSAEAPKHFIDLEMYGDSAYWKMPLKWEDAVRFYSKDTLLKYGYLPYLIMQVKDSLTRAFKNASKDSILYYAADLGHYIGDAHVPLHTTANYDGQLTNQKGLHGLWETTVPEMELDQYRLNSKHQAGYLQQPEAAVWNAIRHSHDLLSDVFMQEREVSKNFTDSTKFRVEIRRGREVKSFTPDFAKAYSRRLGNTINEQLISSADLLADFLYTSWVDAGRPELENLYSAAFNKQKKKVLKKQERAFRKNELIKDSLLLSRKGEWRLSP